MFRQSIIKNSIIRLTILAITFNPLTSNAIVPDTSGVNIDNLVAGYGQIQRALGQMAQAPYNQAVTISTDLSQATYLLSPNSPLVGPLTQKLLSQLTNGGQDTTNDTYSFTWLPNSKSGSQIEKEPLKSIDINSLLQPNAYQTIESQQAQNVINALSGSLSPLDTINFNQFVANLSGDKTNNIKAKLNEKQVQAYLSMLRSYTASQAVAISNLYQLFTERQPIDQTKLPLKLQLAFSAVKGQIKGPVSTLQLENYMATRRITDQSWHLGLLTLNPAGLQREQIELQAETLAETYQTRMTLERLLATMSVFVLQFNSQIRTQLQNQIQALGNPNNPAPNSGT